MTRSILIILLLLVASVCCCQCLPSDSYLEGLTYDPTESYVPPTPPPPPPPPPSPILEDTLQIGNMAYLDIYNNGNAEIRGEQDLYQKTQMESAVLGHTQYISGITELIIGEDIKLGYDSSTSISTLAPIVNKCARDITINALCDLSTNNLRVFQAVNKVGVINIPSGVGMSLGSNMFLSCIKLNHINTDFSTVSAIESNAFYNCFMLDFGSETFSNVLNYGTDCFNGCSVDTIELSAGSHPTTNSFRQASISHLIINETATLAPDFCASATIPNIVVKGDNISYNNYPFRKIDGLATITVYVDGLPQDWSVGSDKVISAQSSGKMNYPNLVDKLIQSGYTFPPPVLTYYINDEYYGQQTYNVGQTITAMTPPEPVTTASSSFLGWYNLPATRKMPAYDIIATATIDPSYDWDFRRTFHQADSRYYPPNEAYYSIGCNSSDILSRGSGTVKLPYYYDGYPVLSINGSGFKTATDVVELYAEGYKIFGSSLFQGNTTIASATLVNCSTYGMGYMFSGCSNLEYLALIDCYKEDFGDSSTHMTGMLNNTHLRTLKVNGTNFFGYGMFNNNCIIDNPVYIDAPEVWFYGAYGRGGAVTGTSKVHFIFSENTTLHVDFQSFQNCNQNVILTFLGDKLPVQDNTSYNHILRNPNNIVVEFYSNRGEFGTASATSQAFWSSTGSGVIIRDLYVPEP